MQPAIASLILTATAHLISASPPSRRQGVTKTSGSAVAYNPREAADQDGREATVAAIIERQGPNLGAIPESLIPSFGIERGAGKDRLQIGSCDGFAVDKFVPVPCNCPPERALFITRLNQAVREGQVFGQAIEFSKDVADTSEATQKKRATAAIVVLQSFDGKKGVGCPGSSYPNIVTQQLTGKKDTQQHSFPQ